METLTYRTFKKENWEYILLQGAIVENVEDVLRTLSETAGDNCVIDMSRISLVNSCGIVEWVNFIHPFSAKRTVVLDNVPSHVLRIVNMIKSFCGKATIRSVCLEFVCERCEQDKLEQIILGKNMPSPSELSVQIPCPRCQSPMHPSVPEKEAFAFLESTRSKL